MVAVPSLDSDTPVSGCAAVQLETMKTKLSIGGLLEVLGQVAGRFGLGSLREETKADRC
jgi:hypothetical protein